MQSKGRCEASGIKQALYPIDALNLTDIIQQRIEAHDILDIQTYRSLEHAIVRMDIYSAHIYAEVGCYNTRQIQEHSRAVDTAKLNRGKIRDRLLLRPPYLLLHRPTAQPIE